MVKKFGLRKGDVVTGVIRSPREGEQGEFNPLVRLETVNGLDPEQVRNRPEFAKLTPSTRRSGSSWRPRRPSWSAGSST